MHDNGAYVKRFIVLPESRSQHGISWGPFTLAEAREFVRKRGDDGFIVLSGDETDQNPRIWNYVEPPNAR